MAEDHVLPPALLSRLTPGEREQLNVRSEDIQNEILYINELGRVDLNSLIPAATTQYHQIHVANNGWRVTAARVAAAIDTAKAELITEYIGNIQVILRDGPQLVRNPGGGVQGSLLVRTLIVLDRPIGGKPRKTSNKKKRYTLHKRRTYKKKRSNSKKIHKRLRM